MKKFVLLLMALIIICISAFAESAYTGFLNMQELDASLTAELVKCSAFTGESLKAIVNWINSAEAKVHINGDEYFTELYYNNSPIMYFYKDGQGFQIDDMHYYEGGNEDFYNLLEEKDPLYKWRSAKAVLLTAPDLFNKLCLNMEDVAETKKGGTAIKKLEKPDSTKTYTLDGATLQSYWQNAVADFNIYLMQNSADKDFSEKALNKLKNMRFEDKCVIRELLSADGYAFAWRFNGSVLIDGTDKRKTSLTFGKTQHGLYLKLTMPALRGKNKTDVNIAGSLEDGKYAADGSFAVRSETLNTSGRFDISLNTKNGLKGKIDYRVKRKNEKEQRYIIHPSIEADNQSVTGKISYKHTSGERETSLNFAVSNAQKKTFDKSKSIVKTSSLNESALELERERIKSAVSMPLASLLGDVPKQDRQVVLHEVTRLFRLTDDNVKHSNIPKYTVLQEEP